MKLGVTFPQTEIGTDPGAIREFAQVVEGLGFNHLLVYDHVLGADTSHYKDWGGTYTKEDMFHEPFVLYGYIAAVTSSIELTTGIIILPQRQTALVAKQAAEVDVLSGGRLRLGIGIGWNHVEFEALGQDFHVRGKRSEEQIELMRRLWTNEAVTFNGKWDQITAAGLNPLPVQRPIPIWLGGGSEQVLKRVATLSDGWILTGAPNEATQQRLERIRAYAEEAGRDPATIGIEGGVRVAQGGPDVWMKTVEAWRALGATHVTLNTMNAGLNTVAEHLDAVRRFHEAAGE